MVIGLRLATQSGKPWKPMPTKGLVNALTWQVSRRYNLSHEGVGERKVCNHFLAPGLQNWQGQTGYYISVWTPR